MPTLVRFVVMVAGVVALAYFGMEFLVASVKVEPREITQVIEIPKAPK